jgi:hypothetical protein
MQKGVAVARLAISDWHVLQETEEKQNVIMILLQIKNLTTLKIALNGSQSIGLY